MLDSKCSSPQCSDFFGNGAVYRIRSARNPGSEGICCKPNARRTQNVPKESGHSGNLWVNSASGIAPSAGYSPISAPCKVRNPNDFLEAGFALVLKLSTTPLESCPLTRNQLSGNEADHRKVRRPGLQTPAPRPARTSATLCTRKT